MAREATDRAPWLDAAPPRARRGGAERRSLYLPMRDGNRLAVDVHLPADRGAERLPAVVRQTRYFRGVELREPFRRMNLEWLIDHAAETRARIVASGYAWIDVCARGSGASFGHRPCPWSPDEIADGGEVVDWIVEQPWSNGRVGATGVSYDGTSSEFLLVNNHPAVRAIVPRFSLYDVYTDIAFPGGIHLDWFTKKWATFNRALDDNALDRAFALMLRLQVQAFRDVAPRGLGWAIGTLDSNAAEAALSGVLRLVSSGVRRVDEDVRAVLRAAAVASHRDNFDVHQGALAVDFRDDAGVSPSYPEATIDFFSPHDRAEAARSSGAAIYSYSGWLDGAYQHAAIKRFRTIGNRGSRLIVGPWEHGGMQNVSPFSPSRKAAFEHEAEMIRFFDRHLREEGADGGGDDEPRVRYFTMGEEAWRSAETWPPAGSSPQRWYVTDHGGLSPEAPARAGLDEHALDTDAGTGRRTRWDCLLGLLVAVGYGDRARAGRRLLVYRSTPLPEPLEVTGHPIVRLFLKADRADLQLFAYLEDERPDGRVEYVTEGQLRAIHRTLSQRPARYDSPAPHRTFERADAAPLAPGEIAELTFDLLPISWRLGAGHRVRLALAGADVDHFERPAGRPTLAVLRGGAHPSSIELPVMRAR